MSESHLVPVVMPQMGESLSEGTLVKWLKQPGDRVEHDEPLFELSTDKVDTDVPSPAAGTLTTIVAQEGQTVAVGEPVAFIERREAKAAVSAGAPAAAAVATSSPATAKEEPGGHFKSTHAPQLVSFRREPASEGARIGTAPASQRPNRSFSPAVLGDAQRGGLSLAQLTGLAGSGRGGRVTKRDVQRFLESGQAATPIAAQPRTVGHKRTGPPPEFIYRPADRDRVQTMSPVRKRIARHMQWSVRISPHASAQSEADMSAVSAVMEHRAEFRAQFAVPLTYTVFAAAAAVRALQQFPVLNSSVVGDQIVLKPTVHLGVAVALADTDDLIVPVVHRADELSLVGLARAIHDLADRARKRQLRPDDVQGGTFTLTNPGVFGGITGTPILNQPQVAILSLGAVRKQAVVVDDVVVVRPMMALALTFDHRASDGMVAFRFLARVRELLETLPTDWDWRPGA
jgi:2-oxoglutarate dehydrogenase E2 component (dihydrolipoamide succinyltransferase)